jgi:hypothetical protein
MAPPVSAVAAILLVVARAAAQAPPTVSAQPKERQDYEFHNPHAPKPRDDFSQYLFGDWMGGRSKIADRGVTFAVLLTPIPSVMSPAEFDAVRRTTTWALSASFSTRTDCSGGQAVSFMWDSPRTSEQVCQRNTSAITLQFN